MEFTESEPSKIRWRLADFYDATLDAAMPETNPAGEHHPDLVAGDPGRPHRTGHQHPHRGGQPHHQADQAGRLRLPQHGELPASYPQLHHGHPTAQTSSMNEAHPLEIEEPQPRPRRPRLRAGRAAQPAGHSGSSRFRCARSSQRSPSVPSSSGSLWRGFLVVLDLEDFDPQLTAATSSAYPTHPTAGTKSRQGRGLPDGQRENSLIGRPRPLPGLRRATRHYTLICDEPLNPIV